MFLCRNVYGVVTSWTVRQKEIVSLLKCVWSGKKLDSTSKGECFSAIGVHGVFFLKKRRHLWYMVNKMCWSAFWVHGYLKKSKHLWYM